MALLIVKFVIIIGRWRFLFEDGNRNAIIDEADYIISYKPLALKNATLKHGDLCLQQYQQRQR